MSFSMTTEQARNKTKTVTRRDEETWKHLRLGDRVLQVEKAQGLKKGEKQVEIHEIEIVAVRLEPLTSEFVTPEEVVKEGFPGMEPEEFITMYKRGRKKVDRVRRIEFKYVD
ncbi:MAG: hypothetical protein CMJ46_03160 [Planctomyces sp.]|nr:hypothetical protein [Planctomyces sp.]